ncbi:MAG: VTC domain-containing protein, partial [Roseibacillus sp.]|nr:VTC domain-containing protein [Roseibacillus sp.]
MSLSRTEYKFWITAEQYRQWKEEVSLRLAVDQNPGNSGDYPILSQYYDTVERDCYWEKQRGFNSRRKIRLRIYGSEPAKIPPAGFLEVKHKLQGLGVKRRLPMPIEAAQEFGLGNDDVLRGLYDQVGRAGRVVIDEVLGMRG